MRVDDRPPVLREAWFDQTWGGYRQTTLLARDLGPGKHKVRIELQPEKNPQSSGHEFRVLGLALRARTSPTIELTAPNTIITQSCRVVIPPGLVLRDTNDQGVIIIGAPNIEIDFAQGSVLRGSPADTRPDEYKGYGIRLNGHAGVTIRGARISGFWCGLWATKADGLVLEGIDASDNRRAYLKSTPVAEDGGDWLFGHDNDQHEWLKNYAAALYIEKSDGVTVRDSRVWHGQNALCLDRVTASRIYDNDFSFNSGWGIALWRCERNVISRNAVDFCVRGYSHGVYNRGQDSAGIFVFEQNNENVFAENSVTHGGDGFFGFAGREAIDEIGEHPVEWYKRRGNTDNLLIGNDFSYAPAHGIENTFSFGNKYLKNRIVGNAICGIWAGYSRETLIAGNDFEGNGEMGYGLERGGVNIDHGGDNLILQNTFVTNKCGVHLWGGANPEFEKKNWAKANGYASTGSVIAGNTFDGDTVAFHFRGPGQVTLGPNKLVGVGKEMICETNYQVIREDQRVVPPLVVPEHKVFGDKHPVGARPELRGRQRRVFPQQMIISRVADDDAAAAGNTFQTAGEVHFPPKNRVIQDVRVRAHQSYGGEASVDAGAKLQGAQWRPRRQSGGRARRFSVSRALFCVEPFVQIVDGALGFDRGAHAIRGVPGVGRRRAPERHDTIADVFVERPSYFLTRSATRPDKG